MFLRSHSAPQRREVKVQPLDPRWDTTSPQNAVGVPVEAGISSSRLGDSTSAAAAAAAAAVTAAAVPLIKVNVTVAVQREGQLDESP